MAILSLNRAWRIMKENKEHQLHVSLINRGIHMQFEVLVDDQKMIDKKTSDLNELWGDYEVDLDGSSLVLNVFKKGLLGLATEVDLYYEDKIIPQGTLFSLPTMGDRQKKDPMDHDRPEAMIPKLPSKCSACGAPVSMQNVEWVGPLSAQCSRCASAIDVEWKKLG